MAPRIIDVDNLPDPLPPLVLLVGDEELLVGRAVSAIAAAARRVDPAVGGDRAERGARWPGRSCTSCSGRHCSAMPG